MPVDEPLAVDTTRRLGTVLITGGASGLGAAVTHAVAAAGGCPIVLDLRPPANEVPHAIVDLADTRAAERIVRSLAAQHPIDGVVTCAGIDRPGRISEVTAEEWERVVAVNLLGTAAVIRAALPSLEQRSGRIVAIASTLGHRAVADATAYCASKFGVVGFTRALAAELQGSVGVSLLTPGGMHTAFFDDRALEYRPADDAVLADPAHVADAVVYALSRPLGVEIREMVVASPVESSWP